MNIFDETAARYIQRGCPSVNINPLNIRSLAIIIALRDWDITDDKWSSNVRLQLFMVTVH